MDRTVRPVDAARRALCVVALWLPACGGSLGAETSDAAGPETAPSPSSPAVTGVRDATTCTGACGDSSAGAETAAGGPDASDAGDAPDESDAAAPLDEPDADELPPVTRNEVCHVLWPQPPGYSRVDDSFSLAVDPSGNSYIAITYSSNPALDLGVSSSGDPAGIA
ncbi:MAG TPA: hypothetical protein VKU41_24320, partial [Polyangiaceae bacterium]|nr:hypothetical protein [Polyangiaceae bacterium]